MKLRHLKNFIAVCELGSISRAAEQLHMAQPALGLQMRGIEDELGAPLLARSSRGIQPTEAGRIVLDWARETTQSTQEVKEKLRTLASGFSGSITLGLTSTTALAFALPIIAAVQNELPQVRLQLTESPGHVLKEWVGSGRIDCALVFDGAKSVPPDASVVLTEQLFFVTAPGSFAAAVGNTISLEEIFDFPLVVSGENDSIRKTLEDAAKVIHVPLRFIYEIQSGSVIINLVEKGYASAVMPLPIVASSVQEGKCVAIRIAEPGLHRHLYWQHASRGTDLTLMEELQRLVTLTIRTESNRPPWNSSYAFAGAVV
jgi:LysR family nitrogen assimilation transcriptional regulator